jgi:hypothetical protein
MDKVKVELSGISENSSTLQQKIFQLQLSKASQGDLSRYAPYVLCALLGPLAILGIIRTQGYRMTAH